ncbi:hypothetical protein [Bacillus pseudomycoides]|uniref:hypothetical protein n=1 Tax=Bacillus pseudomycoides TaxID=64104 RepID=UPI000BF319D8|nr:hypothetical protein [Bacillus pseudomycoides]MED1539106.1 hypothetical protein [Bacillus pseudomycoides]PGC41437.1 hypothetical protein COM18_11025 [Bacillus pseudomycoides]
MVYLLVFICGIIVSFLIMIELVKAKESKELDYDIDKSVKKEMEQLKAMKESKERKSIKKRAM